MKSKKGNYFIAPPSYKLEDKYIPHVFMTKDVSNKILKLALAEYKQPQSEEDILAENESKYNYETNRYGNDEEFPF
jgi:hypothetical protein